MKNFIYAAIAVAGFTTAQAQTPTLYSGDGTLASLRTVSMAGKDLIFKPNTGSFFINGTTGNVGVNTNTPTETFDVNGNISGKMGLFTNSQPTQTFASYTDRNYKCTVLSAGTLLNAAQRARTFQFFDFPQSNLDAAPTVVFGIEDRAYFTRFSFVASQGAAGNLNLYDKSQVLNLNVNDDGNDNIKLTMPKANSYIGIGTTSFTDGTDVFKLSVAGNIRAQRVKVYTTWADYVFEEGYNLPTLEEVEKHIKEKGHLQDIPSAAEVEAKGIELGEMNKLLLQKVEELTLYMIDQKKANDLQEKHIQLLEEQVKVLSERK
jgi:hypothetical protein